MYSTNNGAGFRDVGYSSFQDENHYANVDCLPAVPFESPVGWYNDNELITRSARDSEVPDWQFFASLSYHYPGLEIRSGL